jgi:hypothetical protein
MKKKAKKLSLSRETLHRLEGGRFRQAVGGGDTHEILTGCACTDTCNTNGGSCGCGSAGCGTVGCPSDTFEILSGCATNC